MAQHNMEPTKQQTKHRKNINYPLNLKFSEKEGRLNNLTACGSDKRY